MNKLKSALIKFFYGRYGIDTLSKVITIVYISWIAIFIVLNIFFPSIPLMIIGSVIAIALVVWVDFRTLSRNIPARRRENEKFCGFFKLQRNKFRDRKTHVYRKCKKCKAVLRLPKAKGKHTVVCPRCKNRFDVRG